MRRHRKKLRNDRFRAGCGEEFAYGGCGEWFCGRKGFLSPRKRPDSGGEADGPYEKSGETPQRAINTSTVPAEAGTVTVL